MSDHRAGCPWRVCGSHRPPRAVFAAERWAPTPGVLCGPLGGRSRHKQGHKRSRERAVAAPSSIAVLKPHLRYLLVSDTHAVTSDTRPQHEPTTASQNRQVISNPNDGVMGERRDKKRPYKLTIARCTPTMRGAGSTTVPCEGPLGGSDNKTTDNRAHSLPAVSRRGRTLLLLVDGGQNRRRDREVPPLEGRPPSVDGRSAARPRLAEREPSVRWSTTLAKCRASLCDAPRGVAAFGGGPTACTRPRWTRRTHPPACGAARGRGEAAGKTGVLRIK